MDGAWLQTLKKCNANIDFKKEQLRVDFPEPEMYFLDGDLTLIMELWDQGAWKDELLGRGETSVLNMMDRPGKEKGGPDTNP